MKNRVELRDEFAGQALAGMLAAGNGILTCEEIADCAYNYADALMEEGDARAKARDEELLKQDDLDTSDSSS